MRIAMFATFCVAWCVLGGTCLPLVDNTVRAAPPGEVLAIAIATQTEDETVPESRPIYVDWSASNLTSEPAAVTLFVESRTDLTRTALADQITFDDTGRSGTTQWDTTGFAGPYAIIARVEAGAQSREVTAEGQITVDHTPTFEFTAPTEDPNYQPSADAPLSIEWTAGDNNATMQLGLDPDTDHASNNEIVLVTDRTLPDPAAADSFSWSGADPNGVALSAGTYNLFARITDNVNDVLLVDAPALITIPQSNEPNEPTEGLVFDIPLEDTTFLADPNATFRIAYRLNRDTASLVDLLADADDNHANGNERTIAQRIAVSANATPDQYDWNGRDRYGNQVSLGIYRIVMSVAKADGTGTPETADATGLVYRRSDPNQPVLSLLEPASLKKVDLGQRVAISWRYDAPVAGATIRIVAALSDDPDTHENDQDILANEPADPNSSTGSFSWQVTSSDGLTPGKAYYLIAYIKSEDNQLRSSAVAGGQVLLSDPTQ